MKNILIINGPNLNMLGFREPHIYGHETLESIVKYTEESIKEKSVKLEWFQSNIEGEIVTKIQAAFNNKKIDALIINPGAYSHTSVAIFDALMLLQIPIIEVHLSNTYKREDFRQVKITARASRSMMEGFGKNTYVLAVLSQLV
jgi:3-dehydroquinate dehydratase-2